MGIVEQVGPGRIEEHVLGLVERLLAGLDELGATVATPRGAGEHGPLVCVASTDPHALVEALQAEHIVTSSRDANLRISLHLYNVDEDVDRILESLARNRVLLARAAA
jgi:selenocysteine lyase/cysteine desulfurase